ncbi:hypothetical protein GOP47_0015812 [Adiantum capillus-veneris]|uniref:Uncharacterized protein n=1 Tax=Adiantum capillus-veneris TaxID=13818 RepID=A0A9D4ULA6_ADICA|nr:hypothetical protein GOP47_0015812 [Adiantum capillus-veneris]
MATSPLKAETDENAGRHAGSIGSILATDATRITELKESRAELLARVQSLREDLQEWRGKLDTQVQTYRRELGDLRNTLNTEVDQLRNEFQDLRESLQKQLDTSSKISNQITERTKTAELKMAADNPSEKI